MKMKSCISSETSVQQCVFLSGCVYPLITEFWIVVKKVRHLGILQSWSQSSLRFRLEFDFGGYVVHEHLINDFTIFSSWLCVLLLCWIMGLSSTKTYEFKKSTNMHMVRLCLRAFNFIVDVRVKICLGVETVRSRACWQNSNNTSIQGTRMFLISL